MTSTSALLLYKLACVFGGVLICFLGYRLFALGIFRGAGDLDGSFKDTKLILKKAAPGTFFALFGALVLGMTAWKGLEFNEPAAVASATAPSGAAAAVRTGRGAGDDSGRLDRERLEARRTEARRTIATLNQFPGLLPADAAVETRTDVDQAIRESKVALIESVWGPDWGEVSALQRWVGQNSPASVPPEFKPVAELYQAGAPNKASP